MVADDLPGIGCDPPEAADKGSYITEEDKV